MTTHKLITEFWGGGGISLTFKEGQNISWPFQTDFLGVPLWDLSFIRNIILYKIVELDMIGNFVYFVSAEPVADPFPFKLRPVCFTSCVWTVCVCMCRLTMTRRRVTYWFHCILVLVVVGAAEKVLVGPAGTGRRAWLLRAGWLCWQLVLGHQRAVSSDRLLETDQLFDNCCRSICFV